MAERMLTTHVLDTARGLPAAGLEVAVARLENDTRRELVRVQTNPDGRTEAPLLVGDELAPGRYELSFDVGAYFSAQGVPQQQPPFLGVVPIQCAVGSERAHYHVPLLCSPWAYATYLGS